MAERKPYTTKIRSEMLEYLKRNWAVTVSAADIMEYLRQQGIEANATTVYRYLDKLCGEHVLIRYADSGAEKAVYQYAGADSHCTSHLHLKCVRCGRVIHLDCAFMDEFRSHLERDHRFRLLCEGDMLHGICGECEAKASDKAK